MRKIVLAVVAGAVLSACGQSSAPVEGNATPKPAAVEPAPTPPAPSKPTPPPFDGTVVMSAHLEGGARPTVVGETNLPDGTELMVSLSRSASSYSGQDKTTVSGGAFRAGPFSQKGADLNPGKYTIDVSTPLAALQPASVQQVIGSDGGKMAGPLAKASDFGGKVVEYTAKVEVGGTADAGMDAAARKTQEQDLADWKAKNEKPSCRTRAELAVGSGFVRDGGGSRSGGMVLLTDARWTRQSVDEQREMALCLAHSIAGEGNTLKKLVFRNQATGVVYGTLEYDRYRVGE